MNTRRLFQTMTLSSFIIALSSFIFHLYFLRPARNRIARRDEGHTHRHRLGLCGGTDNTCHHR